MNNDISFSGWEIIAYSSIREHHSLVDMATIFISNGDDHYYLYDESDKIEDISKMPAYIKEDWVNYNKKDIDIVTIDHHIKKFSEIGLIETNYISSELKRIKRDLTLKKII